MNLKTTRTFRLCVLAAVISTSMPAVAYKEETHIRLSRYAANNSVLSQIDKLNEIGLLYPISDSQQRFPPFNGTYPLSILELIQFGASFEDSGRRAVNHFFNPVNWQPLTVVNPMTGEIIEFLANDSSPAWALEDYHDISGNMAGAQDFSYKHARQYFYDALTKLNKEDRDKNWGMTFQTLGQVIHHLQDMAQPQHVRNDPHLQGPAEKFVQRES